jgi:Putative bacterial sensory transduction regulator
LGILIERIGESMLRASRIEKLLRERDLKFFRASDGESRWLIPFEEGHLSLTLGDDGETLLFRSSAVINLHHLKPSEKAAWWQAAMAQNDRMRLGRWVGYESIHFELPISLEGNAKMTDAQFQNALGVSIASLATGRSRLEELINELPTTQVSNDPLGIFSNRIRRAEEN